MSLMTFLLFFIDDCFFFISIHMQGLFDLIERQFWIPLSTNNIAIDIKDISNTIIAVFFIIESKCQTCWSILVIKIINNQSDILIRTMMFTRHEYIKVHNFIKLWEFGTIFPGKKLHYCLPLRTWFLIRRCKCSLTIWWDHFELIILFIIDIPSFLSLLYTFPFVPCTMGTCS